MDLPRSKKDILYYFKHPLAVSGLLVFGSTFVGNLFAFLFNFISARLLGPIDYGSFAAVMAVIGITGIFSQTLSTTLVKFISDFKGEGEVGKLKALWKDLSLLFFFLGFLVFIFFYLFRFPISQFLNVTSNVSLIGVGLYLWFSFLQTINTATLTGIQDFNFMAAAGFLGSFLKFILGTFFVVLGIKWQAPVAGAILGVALSVLAVYLFTLLPLRAFVAKSGFILPKLWRELLKYSLPAAVSLWGMASLANADVVLVKKFFDPAAAGYYSFAALVGRVVLFASSSASLIMFPLVSERAAGGRRYKHLLWGVFFVTILISLGISAFYFIFPKFTLWLFAGFSQSYASASLYLGLLGFYYLFYSLVNVLVNYYLSLHRTWVTGALTAGGASLQILLISQFHRSFFEVIGVSLASIVLLLIVLLLYFLINERSKNT